MFDRADLVKAASCQRDIQHFREIALSAQVAAAATGRRTGRSGACSRFWPHFLSASKREMTHSDACHVELSLLRFDSYRANVACKE